MLLFDIDAAELDLSGAAGRLRALEGARLARLVERVREALAPRAACRPCYVEAKTEEGVTIEGLAFRSRVLRRHLEEVGRVFPFVMTLGPAVDALVDGTADLLDKYCLGEIANHALRETRRAFEGRLRARLAVERIASMTPGALADWPIEAQREVFALLPSVEERLGVRLTDHLLMLPRRSVAGIYFPAGASFVSCQLCPRQRCEDRKAPYDADKARRLGLEPLPEGS